jgi:hypothetical protein
MKQLFFDYLNKIGIQKESPFFERVELVVSFYSQLCTIQDIFITDHIDAEGNRHYESLWLFSANEAMEAKNFLTKEDYDCTQLKNNIIYWQMTPDNFNFKNSTPTSKLTLTVRFSADMQGNITATKENCESLFDIFKKYILPNLS